MSGQTIRLHRILRTTPDKVYRAFIDPAAMVKWLPPHGFTGEVQAMDARVGGGYKMSFCNFSTGQSHGFGGRYLALEPGKLIRYTDQFDNPELPDQMQVTIQFKEVLCGTELTIVQEGVPDAIPAEFCYAGWQESLALLALLVEADIPDQ
ncbi:SRPBCC family protein [Bowmanella sp. Y26]|uniref:SRPBCC family protein n=1 Tax=Bowmanella yangjiangensis TaxID=2811230 RepID=UPI001BDDBED4|nr:SRPBCC family protein [Bowmanella yangjiangensis]MBT1064117.1 SRPBCC family protein [Bowmanella yangjiangensis]